MEVAVTLAVPVLTEVTNPLVSIVAILPSEGLMLQETEGLVVVLPSLLVPNTVICTVFPVGPVWMVGDTGPTDKDEIVGFTKNPVQLTAKANRLSAARAPRRRSVRFGDDIGM